MLKIQKRPLIFGEVLFDHFPDGSTILGGAPFNVAWHLHAFGLRPLMVSRVGNDTLGQSIENAMHDWGMDCSGLQHDPVHPTGTVEVSFNDGEPLYEIVDQVAYDFIDRQQLPKLNGSWLLYHGSLALRHTASQQALEQLKERVTDCFVDINLRKPWWQRSDILAMMQGARWLKLNGDELTALYPSINNADHRLSLLTRQINDHIVLTGGESGAKLIPIHQGEACSVTPDSAADVVDTVGAGDAFCSIFLAGLLLDWPPELSMQRAQEFASAIVGIRGATTKNKAFYRQFIDSWGIRSMANV